MDLNDIRVGITVLAMISFLGIVAWAWSSRRNADFEAAARLPLEEDDVATEASSGEKSR
jgi:cytochrome c oxidase cbb3-type subunit 4